MVGETKPGLCSAADGIGRRYTLPYLSVAMEQYFIELKDVRKRKAFLKLLKELDYVRLIKVYKDPRKARFAREFMDSLREAKAAERGEVKLQSAKDFLRELRG